MRTKTIKCYQYKELSDIAKQRAKEWFLNSPDDFGAWEYMKENAKEVGIKLDGTHRGTMEGSFTDSPLTCIEKILKNHGEQCETYKTAKKFEEKFRVCQVLIRLKGENEETQELDEKFAEEIEEFLNEILEDYRIMYEKQIEYQYSDEFVNEMMEANEYEFDENGYNI